MFSVQPSFLAMDYRWHNLHQPLVLDANVSKSRGKRHVRRRRDLKEFWIKEALNCERRFALKRAKITANRVAVRLKRLQNQHIWNQTRELRNFDNFQRWDKKKVRQAWRIRRGQSFPKVPEQCPVWSCNRRRRRKHRYAGSDSSYSRSARRPRSRASCLSDNSVRSRSPIVMLRSSPFVDRNGFKVPGN